MSTEVFQNFNPDEWVTQADAARIRGVSRQAINNLIKRGRIDSIEIGGIVFIRRADVSTFMVREPGRPKKMYMKNQVQQIISLIEKCSEPQRRQIFEFLRKEFKIHPIEEKLNIQAEIILEAVNKDEKGLTLRMLRGVIAEAAFQIHIVNKLKRWKDKTPPGDLPYDYFLDDGHGSVRVQVKLQRSKDLKPMKARSAYRSFSENMYVVETQKTRGGTNPGTGEDTRPYGIDEFDILAVSMQPSTNDWSYFLFTLASWLLIRDDSDSKLLKFQPVPMAPNQEWTDNFEECVRWLRSGIQKKIST